MSLGGKSPHHEQALCLGLYGRKGVFACGTAYRHDPQLPAVLARPVRVYRVTVQPELHGRDDILEAGEQVLYRASDPRPATPKESRDYDIVAVVRHPR